MFMITLAPRISFSEAIADAPRIQLSNAIQDLVTEAVLAREDKVIAECKAEISRVLGYAKTETLRNLDRYFRSSSSASSHSANVANAGPPDPRSLRIVFDLGEFARDLLAAIADEQMSTVETAGNEMFQELGRSDPWKLPAQATIDFINARANRLKDVPDEIWQTIQQQISEGLDKGEPIRDIAKRITRAFDAIDEGRASVIATTETHAAYGFSRNEAMKTAGVKFKKWIISGLPNVRHAHQIADGQIVPINQPFLVGGENLQYPGDPAGSPENTINCRCIIGGVLESELS